MCDVCVDVVVGRFVPCATLYLTEFRVGVRVGVRIPVCVEFVPWDGSVHMWIWCTVEHHCFRLGCRLRRVLDHLECVHYMPLLYREHIHYQWRTVLRSTFDSLHPHRIPWSTRPAVDADVSSIASVPRRCFCMLSTFDKWNSECRNQLKHLFRASKIRHVVLDVYESLSTWPWNDIGFVP